MRLLRLDDHDQLSLTKDLIDDIPPYAILSHTWGEDEEEVTFDDLEDGKAKDKIGFQKLKFCGQQARRDDVMYFWVDTCCINKANHVELSEAITSMFRWYRDAVRCYVYLSDVSTHESDNHDRSQLAWESKFQSSRWFTRGWTLQELLAPRVVEFFSCEEEFLGDKKTLEQQIHMITGIPIRALQGQSLSGFSVGERMQWTTNRHTRKKEDKAYCLLGIFDVSMSLRYGEGDKAFARLERKVKDTSKHDKIITWLAPARYEELQAKASVSRYPGTGLSFTTGLLLSWLQDELGENSLMWITGKSGSGKTTLLYMMPSSYAVETIKEFVTDGSTTLFAYHYCAFSDPDSQKVLKILISLVIQIAAQQPDILEDLKEHFERDVARDQGNTLQVWELEQVLVKYVSKSSTAIFLFDALDESEDFFESSRCILHLLEKLPKLKILITSTRTANTTGMSQWPHLTEVDMHPDEDIRTFVESNLSDNVALRYLSSQCKEKVKSVLIGRADQTFRWVCLTLDNLCRQRTGRAVLQALTQLPKGLDQTYATMLGRIPDTDRIIAREALLWLCFATRPMTIIELSEAAVLEDSDKTLNQDSRLHRPEVILEICHGFLEYDVNSSQVKLAHSSVRDYLLSPQAKIDNDSFFSFNTELGNQILMQKCLTYLMFDEFRSGVMSRMASMVAQQRRFPLLTYAAHNWGQHARCATETGWSLVENFLNTRNLPHGGNYGAWVTCLIPDCRPDVAMNTEPLYYAASFGMTTIVQHLLSRSTPINLEHPGGRFGSTALQVACWRGMKDVAEILVAAGADFWSDDSGTGEPAWLWARRNGWTDLVNRMIQLRPEILVSIVSDQKRRSINVRSSLARRRSEGHNHSAV